MSEQMRIMRSKELPEELRDRIVARHRSGQGYKKISAALKVPKSTVKNLKGLNAQCLTHLLDHHPVYDLCHSCHKLTVLLFTKISKAHYYYFFIEMPNYSYLLVEKKKFNG